MSTRVRTSFERECQLVLELEAETGREGWEISPFESSITVKGLIQLPDKVTQRIIWMDGPLLHNPGGCSSVKSPTTPTSQGSEGRARNSEPMTVCSIKQWGLVLRTDGVCLWLSDLPELHCLLVL